METETVVKTAIKYIGQTEKPGNMGFNDQDFEKKMNAVGFQKTHAWCSYFVELVFKEANPDKLQEFDKLFSASATKTYQNFVDAGYPFSKTPTEGALVIWQNMKAGKPHWTGHAGVVVKVIDNITFESVEGNTNDGGGREGYIVARRIRKVLQVKEGLRVMGFIKI